MWNEVVLLASGLACGWSLVNLLAAPREQVRGIWVRLLLGAAAGLGMVIWLAVSSLSSGLAGLIIVAGTALIAYAANAKQVNRQPIVFPPHQPNVAADAAGSAVLLVTVAEPSQYNGPAYWSQALLLEDKVPHWMTRPRAYAHIRQAYALMGDSFPLDAELAALTHRLSATLPEVHIGYAYLGERREFLARLVKVAESGVHRLVLVPLEEEPRLHETLLDLVQRSGINETNLEVVYAPAQALTVTSRSQRLERLRLLQASQAVSVSQISAEDESKLVDAIGQSLEQVTALSNI